MKAFILFAVAGVISTAAPLTAQTLWIPGGMVGTSSNGNVGIGTTSPGATLDVIGNAWIRGGVVATTTAGSGATTEMLKLISGVGTNTSGTAARIAGYTDVVSGYIDFKRFGSAGPVTGMVFGTFAGDVLTIRSSGSADPGNVGIGTITPLTKLGIIGDIGAYSAGGTTSSSPVGASLYLGDSPFNTSGSYNSAPGLSALYDSSSAGVAGALGFYTYVGQANSRAERLRITASGNVGIGTSTPGARLEVTVTSNAVNIVHGVHNLNGSQAGGNAVGIGFLNETNGTWWKAAIVHERLNGYGVGSLHFLVDDRITNETAGLAQARMTITATGNVGIGTTNPTQKLSVNGTIRAKEVIVDTGWSDYVFAPDYKLAPLSEVETHIKENGHLPGIPSAKEVAEHGVSMGEMQSKLLAKIEELTLHQIEQEKRLATQMSLLATQSRQLEQQAVRLTQLENENALLTDSHP